MSQPIHELLRCPACHRWTDTLLVWAAGDCCPSCNSPLSGPVHDHALGAHEHSVRAPLGMSRSQPSGLSSARPTSDIS